MAVKPLQLNGWSGEDVRGPPAFPHVSAPWKEGFLGILPSEKHRYHHIAHTEPVSRFSAAEFPPPRHPGTSRNDGTAQCVVYVQRYFLSDDLDLNAAPLTSLSVHRNLEEESAIAAMLLGEAVTAEHQGGGIYSYAGSYGTVHFRSNGNFDYAPVNQRINDPADFCETFL